MEITGKYSKAIVFTENIEEAAISQVYDLLNTKMTENETVRIMEDCHAGKGCVVGYTQTYSGGPLDPDVVGCDIGCGLLSVNYKMPSENPDLVLWDTRIRRDIPMGMEVNEKPVIQEKEFKKFFKTKLERARSLWPEFVCYEGLGETEKFISKTLKRIGMDEGIFYKSLGTLGGGNHFLELGQTEGDKDSVWVTIHTGSRNLGIKILAYWKKQIGKTRILKADMKAAEKGIKEKYKGQGRKIKEEIEKLHTSGRHTIPPSRFLVTHEDISGYLGDMFFAQAYAEYNRLTISERVRKALGFGKELERIESVHNYIDPRDKIIRKGSIQAYSGQKVIIPMNMAFGTLICEGLGNPERNYSAPHGAGRLMSRREAREKIDLSEFKESMTGVYSSSICNACIDEAPGVYKRPEEIITGIQDTVKILEIIKPILSIKSGVEEDD